MKARILPHEEWHRINSPDLPALLPFVEPQNIDVIVAEDDFGQIVGCACVMRVTHIEGLWIAPEHRGGAGVFRAMKRLAYTIPRSRGEEWVFGGAADGDRLMASVCERLGGRPMPLKFFALPVGGN